MRILIFFLLAVFGFCAPLQKEYFVKSNIVYSVDILKNVPIFPIGHLGDGFELSIPSEKIITLFERHKIKLESTSKEVKFIYQTPKEFAPLQQQIKDYFLKTYPELHIKEVHLRTSDKTLSDLTAMLNPSILKRNKFNFFAKSNQQGGAFFVCEIEGEIDVYIASENIRSRQSFDSSNITKQTIPFVEFSQEPATLEEIQKSQARAFIKAMQTITRNKLSPRTLVQKGDMIDVFLYENGVRVEMRVEAMRSGALGEVIRAKNPTSKKTIKVKVTAKGKGEVL